MLKYVIIAILVALTTFSYLMPLGEPESPKVFLSISTFLFAVFTGFFISRQGRRYSDIRKQIANFDGEMSAIYRYFGHFGARPQKQAGKIIGDHFRAIVKHGAWDYHFTHKSTTITDLNNLVDKMVKNNDINKVQNAALSRVLNSLGKLQISRKNMVALQIERIPQFQWMIIYFLAGILLLTVGTMSSHLFLIGSMIKGTFATVIICVVVMLHAFDSLHFFEGTMGEKSAKDAVRIIEGKR